MVIISLSHPTGVQTELMKKPFLDSFYGTLNQCVKDNVLYFWHTSPSLYSKLYKPKMQVKEITLLKQLSRTATYVAPVYTRNVIHGAIVS